MTAVTRDQNVPTAKKRPRLKKRAASLAGRYREGHAGTKKEGEEGSRCQAAKREAED